VAVDVGSRVAWTGWEHFGTRAVRCTGVVEVVGLGVPRAYHYSADDGEFHEVLPRRRAAQVKRDNYELHPCEKPLVISLEDLEEL